MTPRQLSINIIRRLRQHGHESLLAGGCVRDRLLGVRPKDYDVATSASPQQVQELFSRTLPVGAAFGVIIVMDGDVQVEVATFRSEGPYADGRHPSSVRFATAEEDARRRDFTINAMFYDPLSRRLIDFVGGRSDLEKRVIRAVGDARERFREDHLRMLRAVRFASRLDFSLARSTRAALKELAPLVARTSGERIRDELEQILSHPHRAEALEMMLELGLLEVILPEVAAMKGVEQGAAQHPEGDVWQHTLLCMSQLRQPDLVTALATLLHDAGKPPTHSPGGSDGLFPRHAQVSAEIAAEVAGRLRLSSEQRKAIVWAVAHHMDFLQIHQMRRSTLKRLFSSPYFDVLAEVKRADQLGTMKPARDYRLLMRLRRELAREELKPDPLIRGADLLKLGMLPGPDVGRILATLYEAQLEGELTDRQAALERARALVAELEEENRRTAAGELPPE